MHTQNFALVKEPQSHCQMLPWFYLDMHTFILICTHKTLHWWRNPKVIVRCYHDFILICTLLSWYAHTKLCTGEGTPKSLSDATMILSWYAHFYLDMHTFILICTHKTLHWWRNPKVIVRCYHDFILICTLLSWYAHFYLDMHTQNFALVKEPQSHCQMLPWFYLDMHTFILICTLLSWYAHTKLRCYHDFILICYHDFILICTLLSWYAHTKLCTGEGTPKSLSDAILSWYAHFYLDMHTQNFALVKEPQSHCQMLPWFYLDMHTFKIVKNKQKLKTELARVNMYKWRNPKVIVLHWWRNPKVIVATMILSWYAHFYLHFYLDMHTQNFALVKEPQSHCQMLPWFYLDMHTFILICTLLSWYAHTKLCTGEGTPKSLSDATMILSWYAHF